ncbi:MAG: glycosyltransferase family 2 protein [Bacteroidota bacterium]
MKVTGFTFVRNAVTYDYPVVEAITSILPVCDEFVVLVGDSQDETRSLIESIGSDKIRIIDSVWDESLREGGRVLAAETDKAFRQISSDATWAFYIQADEVVHEQFLPTIKKAFEQFADDADVEGLLFRYKHFYGSYDYVGDSTRWYRNEVRVVRFDSEVRSYRDAQGFRKSGRPLVVEPIDACIYHYGWVKPPEKQQAKQLQFHRLWHSDDTVASIVGTAASFDYSKIDSLALFDSTHPQVMKQRIASKNWTFDFDPASRRLSFKSRFKMAVERITGWRIGEYKNYRLRK